MHRLSLLRLWFYKTVRFVGFRFVYFALDLSCLAVKVRAVLVGFVQCRFILCFRESDASLRFPLYFPQVWVRLVLRLSAAGVFFSTY